MSEWEIKQRGRHISAWLNKDITVGDTTHSVRCDIHSKYSPDMGGKNFSWSVKCGDQINISGNTFTFELCQENVDTVINQALPIALQVIK